MRTNKTHLQVQPQLGLRILLTIEHEEERALEHLQRWCQTTSRIGASATTEALPHELVPRIASPIFALSTAKATPLSRWRRTCACAWTWFRRSTRKVTAVTVRTVTSVLVRPRSRSPLPHAESASTTTATEERKHEASRAILEQPQLPTATCRGTSKPGSPPPDVCGRERNHARCRFPWLDKVPPTVSQDMRTCFGTLAGPNKPAGTARHLTGYKTAPRKRRRANCSPVTWEADSPIDKFWVCERSGCGFPTSSHHHISTWRPNPIQFRSAHSRHAEHVIPRRGSIHRVASWGYAPSASRRVCGVGSEVFSEQSADQG